MEIKEIAQIVTALLAIGTFAFGIVQFRKQEANKLIERRIEARRPFLELQLKFYQEAASAASVISSSQSQETIEQAARDFEELFWGKMALVEDAEVENAMVWFKKGLEQGEVGSQLQARSLHLAHACRASLAKSWGTEVWNREDPGD